MKDYYYSGIEGLCRSIARLSSPDPAGRVQEAAVARDIFHDAVRFDKAYNVSRTWHLTPLRRASQFVQAWVEPAGRSATRANRDLYDRTALAICVEAMVKPDPADPDAPTSIRDVLAQLPSPLASLRDEVVPAMVDGFATERYPSSVLVAFERDMDQLLDRFVRLDDYVLRKVLARVVGAAVFGPMSPLALSDESVGTGTPDDLDGLGFVEPAEGDRVQLTQVYDRRLGRVGTSLGVTRDRVLFVGRSSKLDDYRGRFVQALGDEEAAGFNDALEAAEVFRVPDDNKSVSNVHGAVFHNGAAWTYLDLGSSFGSVVVGERGAAPVSPLCVLAAGDWLVLGTNGTVGGEADFCPGATLVFSELTR